MLSIKSLFLLPEENIEEFSSRKFARNNFMILVISSFLFLEQLVYALFISEPNSILQRMYLFSSFSMTAFIVPSCIFSHKKPKRPTPWHKGYELSLSIFGLGVILLRVLFQEADLFRVPTVYIAVLYGAAVVFLYHYLQSLIMYISVIIGAIALIPLFHPEVQTSSFVPDVVVNGIIAWIVSAFNYRYFVRDFQNTLEIQRQNKELIEKNHQIEQANQDLEDLAVRDELTGLFNRRKLNDVLSELVDHTSRREGDFSVILLDLDRFKVLNDTYGHDIGDCVLKDLADLLKKFIPEHMCYGRWGGEEFLILCPDTNLRKAVHFAEDLRQQIASQIFAGAHSVTASFGVTSFHEHPDSEMLLTIADRRLYEAKRKGRNCVEFGPFIPT